MTRLFTGCLAAVGDGRGRRPRRRRPAAASRCSSARCSARPAPPTRGRARSICSRSRPSCATRTSTPNSWPSLSTLGQTQYQSDAPHVALQRAERPAGVRLAAVHLRLCRSASISASTIPRASRAAIWRAPIWPSRRRGSGRRSSRCGRKSTTRSSPRRCCRSRSASLDATIADLEARLQRGEHPRARRRGRPGRCRRDRGGPAPAAPAGRVRCARTAAPRCAVWKRSPGRAIDRRRAGAAARSARPSVAQAREALTRERARPEYAQFDRARDRAPRQQALTQASDRPQLSAYRPRRIRAAGARFHQRPARVVRAGRRAVPVEGMELELVGARARGARAPAEGRRRRGSGIHERPPPRDRNRPRRRSIISRPSLPVDDRIVSLREGIDRTARVRLGEGVITASEYLDRHTEWLTAQFERARHRVELAQARARVLTTLGLEVQ